MTQRQKDDLKTLDEDQLIAFLTSFQRIAAKKQILVEMSEDEEALKTALEKAKRELQAKSLAELIDEEHLDEVRARQADKQAGKSHRIEKEG